MTRDTEPDPFSRVQPFLGMVVTEPEDPHRGKNINPSGFSPVNLSFLFMQHFCIVLTNVYFLPFVYVQILMDPIVSPLQVINIVNHVHG